MGELSNSAEDGGYDRSAKQDSLGLTIRLLGPLAVRRGNKSVEIASRKARALLAFIVCRTGEPISRETLTGILWGDRPEAQARASLRQALSELRAVLGEEAHAIEASKEFVSWRSGVASIDLDLVTGRTLADEKSYEAALLASGELLEGLSLDEPPFEQWLIAERARLRRAVGSAIQNLMRDRFEMRDYEAALALGLKGLAFDPLREQMHREVMRILAQIGRSDAALGQYERLKQDLARELGVAPERDTEALALQIRANRRTPSPPVSEPPSAPTAQAADPRPCIAVMPFEDLTGEAGHEHLAKGMTDDITDALSRVSELVVLSRVTNFPADQSLTRAEQTFEDLGVGHVLEGSVRRAGSALRVSARLLSVPARVQVWSARYDGQLTDVFAFQDELARSIAVALQVELTTGDAARLWQGQTKNVRAWEVALRARSAFLRYTATDSTVAQRYLEEAIALDPSYTAAMVDLGICHYWRARYIPSVDEQAVLAAAKYQLAKVKELDPDFPGAITLGALLAFMDRRFVDAIALAETAVRVWPTDARSQMFLGIMLMYQGDARASAIALNESLRLSPFPEPSVHYFLGIAEYWRGRMVHALEHSRRHTAMEPLEPYGLAYEAVILSAIGNRDDASQRIERLCGAAPSFGLHNLRRSERYQDPERLNHLLRNLGDLGLGE
jgi:DNA-binding SARP family transcriptional activator/Flp pilus assembly protein TadD